LFHRVLIANRGEVAARVARTCRSLGIAPVGVASTADLGASWLEAMDEVVCVGPPAARDSYLRSDRILQAALQTHCSAIHPGWGFLAEDARFASLCEQHRVTFIGPPAAIISRMGRKSPAKRAMQAAGLPVIPGSGPLASPEEAARWAAEVGYPVLLKADAGGGGRGMRKCVEESELKEAFASARSEAESAFGSGVLYLEKYLVGGRHVEVQVLVDRYGNAIHLGERDCSVQRKHQKLVEEAGCPVLTDEQRAELCTSSAQASSNLGYVGAGTIEFLRDADGSLYFMEMNTRLQVEHPVSEMITGVDIVQLQLEIAAGRPLSVSQSEIEFSGHAIEVRLNAEDPHADFQPSPGTLERFDVPTDRGPGTVRFDTHLREGEKISPHYDSLIGKVIAHGATRAEAVATMLAALRGATIQGVATTLPLHVAVLDSEEFATHDYDTTRIPGWPLAKAAT